MYHAVPAPPPTASAANTTRLISALVSRLETGPRARSPRCKRECTRLCGLWPPARAGFGGIRAPVALLRRGGVIFGSRAVGAAAGGGAGSGSAAGALTGGACWPPARSMLSASRLSVSRVWSGMMLDFFCVACAICACARPGSVRFSSARRCCSATCAGCGGKPWIGGMFLLVCATDMKACQAVVGRLPPVTPWPFSHMGRKSSCPTHTPVTSAPVKPTNQASRQLELVPVLPTAWVKSRMARRPVPSLHHRLHHLVHLLDHALADDLRGRRLVTLARVDELALGVEQLEDRVGPGQPAAIGKHGVGAGVLEQRDAGIAERHGARSFDAVDAEPPGHLQHFLAARP